MAEYIELQTAIDFVKNNTPTLEGMTTLGCVERALYNAPKADVEEVVRCKDCRFCEYDDTVYRKTVDGEESKPAYICFRSGNGQEVDGNHFCSYGERKGDGDGK